MASVKGGKTRSNKDGKPAAQAARLHPGARRVAVSPDDVGEACLAPCERLPGRSDASPRADASLRSRLPVVVAAASAALAHGATATIRCHDDFTGGTLA